MVGDDQQLILSSAPSLPMPAVFRGPAQAERRFWEFFTTQISNDNTRKAYFNAVRTFSAWCQSRNIGELRQVVLARTAAPQRRRGRRPALAAAGIAAIVAASW